MSLYRFALEIEDFESFPPEIQKRIQLDAICALINANYDYLRQYPGTPPLYESGCVFIAENQPFVLNCWQNIPRVIECGGSHCVGLTAWRVAELRIAGEQAMPEIHEYLEDVPRIGRLQEFHFVVRRQDGELECPSTELGMPT